MSPAVDRGEQRTRLFPTGNSSGRSARHFADGERVGVEVFGEKPPVAKVAGQPVLEWVRACGVDITDVILLRRNSRERKPDAEEQGAGAQSQKG